MDKDISYDMSEGKTGKNSSSLILLRASKKVDQKFEMRGSIYKVRCRLAEGVRKIIPK